MATSLASLDAASNERKARLAQLKSLKRKRPDGEQNGAPETEPAGDAAVPSVASLYLSGRNYDSEARGPKLGFENQPIADQDTLEQQAADIATATRQAAAEEEKADKPIDLFKLQPKKPNWDLKRDVEKKLERLDVQTDNAIARIVRERIAAQKQQQKSEAAAEGSTLEEADAEAAAIGGGELLESVHQREREAAHDSADSDVDSEDERE